MTTVYDAKDTVVTVNGVYITGMGENMIAGEKSEDYASMKVGAQGDVVKNIINDPTGEVTITIQRTSPSKDYLMSLAGLKENFPLWCVNKALGERMGGSEAFLKSSPSVEDGQEGEDMEFVFGVADYTLEPTK